jgi:hypothetical protein
VVHAGQDIPVNTVRARAGYSKACVTTDIIWAISKHSDEWAAEEIKDIAMPLTFLSNIVR